MRPWEIALVALFALMLVVSVAMARSHAVGIEAGITRTAEQRREAQCQEARERARLAEEFPASPDAPGPDAARLEAQIRKFDAARDVDQYCR
jgi:hypothetical protein